MKISTKGRYGLKALIDIAAHQDDGFITLKSVAARQGISKNYLEQLISILKEAGFVKSVRGQNGGYCLSCEPDKTSVGDILRALEGSLCPVECLTPEEKEVCGSSNCRSCVTRPIWEKIYESLNDVLDSIYLDQLVIEYKQLNSSDTGDD